MTKDVQTITVFGITGRTGMALCPLLLEKNYYVKALVRNKSKVTITHPNLEVHEGSLENPEHINNIIKGSQAVISVLGHSKNSPAMFQTNAMKLIVSSMKKNNCKRIIILTGAGVVDKDDQNSIGNKALTFLIKKIAKKRFEDGEKQCEILTQTDLDWTILKAPVLTNSQNRKEKYYLGKEAPGIFSHISRTLVAQQITEEIGKNAHLRTQLFIWQ